MREIKIDWNRHNRAREQREAPVWPNENFDWTGAATVPANQSKASGWIVGLGTAFAFAVLPGGGMAYAYKEEIAKTISVAQDTIINTPSKLWKIAFDR